MDSPTYQELLDRIAQLQDDLKPKSRSPRPVSTVKAREKARKAQFKLDAYRRKMMSSSINRYSISH